MKRWLARYGTSLSHRGSFPLHAGMRLAHSTSLMVRLSRVPEPRQKQFIKHVQLRVCTLIESQCVMNPKVVYLFVCHQRSFKGAVCHIQLFGIQEKSKPLKVMVALKAEIPLV